MGGIHLAKDVQEFHYKYPCARDNGKRNGQKNRRMKQGEGKQKRMKIFSVEIRRGRAKKNYQLQSRLGTHRWKKEKSTLFSLRKLGKQHQQTRTNTYIHKHTSQTDDKAIGGVVKLKSYLVRSMVLVRRKFWEAVLGHKHHNHYYQNPQPPLSFKCNPIFHHPRVTYEPEKYNLSPTN